MTQFWACPTRHSPATLFWKHLLLFLPSHFPKSVVFRIGHSTRWIVTYIQWRGKITSLVSKSFMVLVGQLFNILHPHHPTDPLSSLLTKILGFSHSPAGNHVIPFLCSDCCFSLFWWVGEGSKGKECLFNSILFLQLISATCLVSRILSFTIFMPSNSCHLR